MSITVILEVVALICLICAAVNVPSNHVGLGWLGMALWLLAVLIGGGGVLLR